MVLKEIRSVGNGEYEIEFEGEDDTLGNLLASYLEDMDGVRLAYYKRPHPLEERIILYVKLEEGRDVKNLLIRALEFILRDINDLHSKYIEALPPDVKTRLEESKI